MSAKLGKSTRIVGAVLTAGALAFGGATTAGAATVQAEPIQHVTGDNVDQVIESSNEQPVIFDVGAEWCGPCQELKPVIEGFAKDDAGKWVLGQVDADESPGVVEKFGVEGFPTVVAYNKGKEVDRFSGYSGDESQVRQFIDGVLQG